jgi:hypothetical protein
MNHIKLFLEYLEPDDHNFSKFITKSLSDDYIELGYDDRDFDNIKRLLERGCGDFISKLRESDDNALIYRGVNSYDFDIPGLIMREVRKDRNPRDMKIDVADELDMHFKDKFGIGLRRSGVFATKSFNEASRYATMVEGSTTLRPFIFFPIGDYDFYYSKSINDLFEIMEEEDWYRFLQSGENDYYLEDVLGDSEVYKKDFSNDDWQEKLDEVYEKMSEDRDKFIRDVVNSYEKGTSFSDINDQEITFICDNYYVIDSAFYDKVIEWLYA